MFVCSKLYKTSQALEQYKVRISQNNLLFESTTSIVLSRTMFQISKNMHFSLHLHIEEFARATALRLYHSEIKECTTGHSNIWNLMIKEEPEIELRHECITPNYRFNRDHGNSKRELSNMFSFSSEMDPLEQHHSAFKLNN